MNKMLPTPTRIKHEREITVLLSTLSEHTSACEKRISELEKQLKSETSAAAEFRRSLRKSEQQVAGLQQRVDDAKGEAAALATDLKLAKAAHRGLEKELANAQAAGGALEAKLTAVVAEKERVASELATAVKSIGSLTADVEQRDAQLADAKADIDAYEVMVAEFRDTDAALRERIALLESQLSDERTKAGKDLLLRIMELETMLDAERNKVSGLQELPNMVKLESHAVAANTNSIKTRRRVSGKNA